MRFVRHHLSLIPDQPWQQRGIQRHRLPHCRCDLELLHHLHLVRRTAQDPRRPFASRSVEPWPRRPHLQYHRSAVPVTGLRLCVLPVGNTGRASNDELELSDIWSGRHLFDLLLLCFRESCV